MLPRLARSCTDEDGPLRLLRSGAGDDRTMVSDGTLSQRIEETISEELLCQYWGTADTGETEAQYMTRIVLAEVDVAVAVFRDGFESEHRAWLKSENEIDRMAQQIVKLSLTQDRMGDSFTICCAIRSISFSDLSQARCSDLN